MTADADDSWWDWLEVVKPSSKKHLWKSIPRFKPTKTGSRIGTWWIYNMNMCLFFFRRSFSEVYMIRSSCRRESCGPPMSNPWLEEKLPISFCNGILFQVSGRILIKWQFASISNTNFMAFGNSCSTKTALILLVWSTFTTNYDWISSTVV